MKIANFLFLLSFLFVFNGLAQPGRRTVDEFIKSRKFDNQGRVIAEVIVPGKPPDTYRAPNCIIRNSAVVLSDVPAFSWSFGCSPTAASMAAGFYDNQGYANMYTGPANGGVVPMDNSGWGTTIINGETLALCPLSATMLNLDGRTSRGHVDDYWIQYNNISDDPYISNGWTQHTSGDCTADFMGTNQSILGNPDGSTSFSYYTDGSPLYDYSDGEPGFRDGCHGLRLFYQSRGYSVLENYTQPIYGQDGNTLGFTFNQYKNEINNGRPVLIQVAGHTMLGFGYDESGSIVYLHDTWDYGVHSMIWGSDYAGMAQWGVTVVKLAPINSNPIANFTATTTSLITGGNVSFSDLSAGNPTSWQWSFPGGLPSASNLQNPEITYNSPGIYSVTLVVTNSNGSNTEIKTNYITVSDPSYCQAQGACDEFISEVHLGSINSISGCGMNGYTNFSNLSTNLVTGSSYTLTIVNGNPVYPDDQCGVWFDWNRDFDFDDSGEFLNVSGSPGSGPYSLNFTVPSSAAPGYTGMRIRILYSGSIPSCGQTEWGETEDYSVCILPNSNSKVLNAKLFLEGLYDGSMGLMKKARDASGDHFPGSVADQVSIKLAQADAPHNLVAQANNINLDQNGNCTAIFSSALNGSYYLVVYHRNSIATWSAYPVSFVGSAISYNFAFDISKAYGNNMIQKQGKFCMYGGDVNQDGHVNLTDMNSVKNLSDFYGSGYLPGDVNGDGTLDTEDMIIIDNNFTHGISSEAP